MFAEITGSDIALIITAFGAFVTTVVGAIVTLRHEFAKAISKIDDVQTEVSDVHTAVTDTKTVVDSVQTDVQSVKNTVNGGSQP